MATTLETKRLLLVPMTRECLSAVDDAAAIARVTRAHVPDSWPVEHYDQDVLDFTRKALDADPETEFVIRYMVLREPLRTVIGMFGVSEPTDDGRLVIGYSVLPEHRRQGFASEALAAVVAWGFRDPRVMVISGDTYPELTASIKTMESCGFTFAGAGEGDGVIRYELPRVARAF